jgi:hypothetical protein
MNIFDQLRDIISNKNDMLAENCDMEKEFVPYMTQRWLSFYSPSFAQLVNNTSNVLWKSMEDKQIWYKFFTGIIPKSSFRSIKYIKKNKDGKKVAKIDKDMLTYLAERFELSEREVKAHLETGMIDIKMLKKQLQDN